MISLSICNYSLCNILVIYLLFLSILVIYCPFAFSSLFLGDHVPLNPLLSFCFIFLFYFFKYFYYLISLSIKLFRENYAIYTYSCCNLRKDTVQSTQGYYAIYARILCNLYCNLCCNLRKDYTAIYGLRKDYTAIYARKTGLSSAKWITYNSLQISNSFFKYSLFFFFIISLSIKLEIIILPYHARITFCPLLIT